MTIMGDNEQKVSSDDQSEHVSGWGRAVPVLFAILLPGFLCFVYLESRPALYEAHSKILLLSSQEQYVPKEKAAAASGEREAIAARGVQGANYLQSDAFLSALAKKLQLTIDQAQPNRSLWQQASAAIGLPDTSSDAEQVPEGIARGLHVSFNEKLRFLDVTYQSSDPLKATVVANAISSGYLDHQRLMRGEQNLSAVRRLRSDIAALEMQRRETYELQRAQTVPVDLSEDALAQWKLREEQRVSSLKQKADAQSRMIDKMLARQQEAETKIKFDLSPPNARILSRATLPEDPIDRKSILNGVAVSCSVGLVVLLFMGARRLRRKRKTAFFIHEIPGLPLDASLTPASHFISDLPQDDGQGADQGAALYEDDFDDLNRMVFAIGETEHKRILLISEEEDWNGLMADVALQLASSEKNVLLIDLQARDNPEQIDGNASNGLSDFLDGYCDGEDILTPTEFDNLSYVGVGYRDVTSKDFFSSDLHALLLAVEALHDVVVINLGGHYDDEFALKSLALARDVQACLYAPEVSEEMAPQVREAITHFGYHDCQIFPLDAQMVDHNAIKRDHLNAA